MSKQNKFKQKQFELGSRPVHVCSRSCAVGARPQQIQQWCYHAKKTLSSYHQDDAYSFQKYCRH